MLDATMDETRTHSLDPRLLLGAILALALALRLTGLGAESAWIDEVGAYHAADQPTWTAFWQYMAGHERTPPLYYLLLRGWLALGEGVWWARLLSTLLGVAGIGLVYLVAARSLSRSVGLLAAFLLAVSPYHLYYSQEIRSYILQFVGTTLAAGGLAMWLRAPKDRLAPLLFVAGGAIALGSGYLSLLTLAVLLALLLHAAWRGVLPWGPALGAGALALALGAPFWWLLPAHLGLADNFTPRPPGWGTLLETAGRFVAGVRPQLPGMLTLAGGLTLLGLLAWSAVGPSGNRFQRVRDDPALRVWLAAAVAPLLLLYGISFARPLMLGGERYAIIALGPCWVCAAQGLWHSRGIARAAAWAVLISVVLPGLLLYHTTHEKYRWNAVADYLATHGAPGDLCLTVPLSNVEVLDFYGAGGVTTLYLPAGDGDARQALADRVTQDRPRRVWLASITAQQTSLDVVLQELGYRGVDTTVFPANGRFIRLSRYQR